MIMDNFTWRWQDDLSGPENGQMTLSVNKHEVMPTGRNNPKYFYFVCIAKGFELTVPDPKWGPGGGLAEAGSQNDWFQCNSLGSWIENDRKYTLKTERISFQPEGILTVELLTKLHSRCQKLSQIQKQSHQRKSLKDY